MQMCVQWLNYFVLILLLVCSKSVIQILIILLYSYQIQQEMFYSSKTQSFDQENYNPNQYFEHPTLTQGVVINDMALSKAISIIQQLKQNLAFALKLNEALLQENEQLKASSEKATKKINMECTQWQKRRVQMEKQKQDIVDLLQQTKSALLQAQRECEQRKVQIDKCNKIIFEQKKAYEELELNFMNQSLNAVGDSPSLILGKSEIHYISELQRENTELSAQIKRLNQQIEKSDSRIAKFEKQNSQFKKWMANVLGLQKVVEGSEKILMKQIAQRVLPA